MKTVLALSLALLSGTCNADTFGLHIGSQHYPAKEWNNSNPGVYYRSDSGLTVGAYYNSHRRPSVYIGQQWSTELWGFEPSIAIGLITGYKLPVMVAPSIATPAIGSIRARVAFLPKIEKSGSSVVHLMLERKF